MILDDWAFALFATGSVASILNLGLTIFNMVTP